MKIISWNVNGLRSAYRKGFLDWLSSEAPDILCLQEIKAHPDQLPFDLTTLSGYRIVFNPATRRGYSGVAVYTRRTPRYIKKKLGMKRFDHEGRFLELDYGDYLLINLYIPHGNRDQRDLNYKLEVYDALLEHLESLKEKKVILAGDFNVAREEIDLARPQENQKNTMFTKEERAKINQLVERGWIDTFRQFVKDGGHYSWWPYSKEVRDKNIGWRLDYIFTARELDAKLRAAFIRNALILSDHCPVGIEIAL